MVQAVGLRGERRLAQLGVEAVRSDGDVERLGGSGRALDVHLRTVVACRGDANAEPAGAERSPRTTFVVHEGEAQFAPEINTLSRPMGSLASLKGVPHTC